MSNYPTTRPKDIYDVVKGHIIGKVTNTNNENQLWLRDALDIALSEVTRLHDELNAKQEE